MTWQDVGGHGEKMAMRVFQLLFWLFCMGEACFVVDSDVVVAMGGLGCELRVAEFAGGL